MVSIQGWFLASPILFVDFGRKEYGCGTFWRGFNSTPGTYLNSTLGFARRCLFFSRQNRQENGTDSEKLRQEQNATDSGAVVFLVHQEALKGDILEGDI